MGNYSARFGGGHLEKGRNAPRQVSTLRYWAFKPHKRRKTRSTLTEPALGQARNDLGNGEQVAAFSHRMEPQFTKWE